jgi:hypothetical protein
MQEIERLSLGQLLVGVNQRDFADDAAALQGKAGARTDESAAADDGNLQEGLGLGAGGWGLGAGGWGLGLGGMREWLVLVVSAEYAAGLATSH